MGEENNKVPKNDVVLKVIMIVMAILVLGVLLTYFVPVALFMLAIE